MDLQFTFNPVLSISLSSADLLIPNLAPGTSDHSNTITVSVDTTSIAGYTLSAKVGNGTTYTNDRLTNSSSSTYFENLTSSITLANFQSDRWGYTLGTVSNSSSYSALSYSAYTIINATTNTAGTAASSGCVTTCAGTNNTNFTIGAKASATQAYGDYNNVIVFTVVGNTNSMSINDLTYMQDFVSLSSSDREDVLYSMTTGQEYTLIDSRDDEEYYIAKLADGNVWMLDNLRLGESTAVELTNTDSNIGASTWTLPASGNYTGLTAKADVPVPSKKIMADFAFNQKTTERDDVRFLLTAPSPGSCNSLGTYCTIAHNDSSAKNSVVTHYGDGSGKSGTFYTYCAASVGTKCVVSDNDTSDIIYDICPIGWRLPTGGSSGEQKALYDLYSSHADFLDAFSVALAGYYASGFHDRNAAVIYWSSTYAPSDESARFTFRTSSLAVNLSVGTYRLVSASVRCILDN